jgi:glycosyltransferase involved in cell wall biosynthesis
MYIVCCEEKNMVEVKKVNKFKLITAEMTVGLKHSIEKKIRYLGMGDSVIFTGVRSDIPQIIQMMDIFVFPSHYEGLGIALIEAQAAGLSCFISDVIPREAVITKNVYPISLKLSAKAWADVIVKNISYKRNDCSLDIKKSGYDIEVVTKELEDIYSSL